MLIHFILLFFVFHFYQEDVIFFQSNGLKELELIKQEAGFNILDDSGQKIQIVEYRDITGLVYWYRKVLTPVCLTGECMLIDIGIYWDCTGDFFGLEVYGEHLTKTDHSVFTSEDYQFLMEVLKNDWSILREYKLTNLIEEGEVTEVDGTSGATKVEIATETVKNAVYTTYTLWHLVHLGEKEQLINLTANLLKENKLSIQSLTYNEDEEYLYFILSSLLEQKIKTTPVLDSLIVEGLTSNLRPKFKKLAYRSLSKIDLNEQVQKSLVPIYSVVSIQDKIQILSAFERPIKLEPELYTCFSKDLAIANDWFLVKLKMVLDRNRDF